MPAKPKKKVDYEALNSPFMRIPRIGVDNARHLLDLGFREIYELVGRSPEVFWEDLKQKKDSLHPISLAALRMAVYYAENDPPDRNKLFLQEWE